MAVHIDSSLSRGLAAFIARDSRHKTDDLQESIHRAFLRPQPRGRAALYRWWLGTYRTAYAHAIAVDRPLGSTIGRKADQHLFLLWDSLADSLRLGLAALLIRARHFDQLDHTLFVLSQHACERLFQRLGTDDIQTVRRELLTATKTICSIWAVLPAVQTLYPDVRSEGLLVPTHSGALVVVKPDAQAQLVATTWLSNEQLRPEQRGVIQAIQSGSGNLLIPQSETSMPLPPDPYLLMPLVLHGARRHFLPSLDVLQ